MKLRRLCAIFSVFASLIVGNSNAQTNVSFVSHRDFPVVTIPSLSTEKFAQGDLNGDGSTDLVVTNGDTNLSQMTVLIGNRDGSFQAPVLVNTGGAGSLAAVIADFNGDHKNDVAVIAGGKISILLGDGAGGFVAPVQFTVGLSPSALIAGDFNGDHIPDLAVANDGSNDVSLLLGSGNGNFTNGGTFAVGMGPAGIAIGDFNHDGHMDLAVSNSGISNGQNRGSNGNTVAILLGTGTGSFSPATFISVAKGPLGITVGDMNNDTKPDVIVANSTTNQVSMLIGNGDGTFRPPTVFIVTPGSTPSSGLGPSWVSIDDFNDDGNQDLVVSNSLTSTVAVLLGDGKGGLATPLTVEVGRTPVNVLTGDYNHDGKRDFVTSNGAASTVSVVYGKGNGTFRDSLSLLTGMNPAQIAVADFNNDGIPDMATANQGVEPEAAFMGHTVSVLLGQNGGRFGKQTLFNVGTDPAGLVAGDFNHDGRVDLVSANFGLVPNDHGGISLLLGNGDGTFQPALNFPTGDFPDSLAMGDFNNDGNLDVVAGNFGTSAGVPSVSVLLGDGQGGFGKATTIASFPSLSFVLAVAVADFNRDGKADIAFLHSNSFGQNIVSIMLGNGNGTFGPSKDVVTAFIVFSYAIGDFNNDGFPDFAVEEGGNIQMMIGDGQGGFRSAGLFPDGEFTTFGVVQSLAVADFNGDGALDIAAPDGFSDHVSILLGQGNGTLGPPQMFGGVAANNSVAADFNGDQRPDLAISATNEINGKGKVVVIMNNTPSGSSDLSFSTEN